MSCAAHKADGQRTGHLRYPNGIYAEAQTRRTSDMADNTPLVTILCAQCSRHAQVRRGDPLPEGWAEHVGLLSCSEMCREILQSMGVIPDK